MKKKIKLSLLNNISNYVGFNSPFWMQSRKTLLLNFYLDLIVFSYTYFFGGSDISRVNSLKLILISVSWGLFSYIFGRYTKEKENINLINRIYNLTLNTLIVLICIYILDKLIIVFFSFLQPIGLKLFLEIGLLSLILQSIRLTILNKIRKIDESIYLIGNDDDIKFLKSKLRNYDKFKQTNFIKFNDINNLHNNKEIKFKTIIIANEKLKINNQEYLIKEDFKNNIELLSISEWFEKYLQKIPVEGKLINPLKYNIKLNKTKYLNRRIKRFGDISISIILLLISSPLILFIGICIKFEDKGPIFYKQKRTGLFEEIITIIKLRSMKINSENKGPVWAETNDKRITKVGYFIRKTRLDELPQLWNVLIGDMSLIGPRPERPEIEEDLNIKIPNYKLRHIIKPGLSGWAQVNYPYGASIFDSTEKLSYDLFYIQNQSILLDILIFIKTIKTVFLMKGN